MNLFRWFSQLFRKSQQPVTQIILSSPPPDLPFPHDPLPLMTAFQLTQAWKQADRTKGFPVLLDMTQIGGGLGEWRCEGDLPDIDAFLQPNIRPLFENKADMEALGDEDDEGPALTLFQSFGKASDAAALAFVPVETPWEIFRLLPFGGWNECPEPPVLAAFCRKIYERFGAVPAVMTGDAIEFFAARHPDAEEAWQLALDIYGLCPDAVYQVNSGSVHALADSLTKSDVWYLWWD